MRNTFLVAVREFSQQVRSRGFIISSILVPLLLILVNTVPDLFDSGDQPSAGESNPPASAEKAIGYVDQANLIRSIPADLPSGLFQSFPDRESADRALQDGDINEYYFIPQDYLSAGEIQRISLELPFDPGDRSLFDYVLVDNLLADAGPQERRLWHDPFGAPAPHFVEITAGSSPDSETEPTARPAEETSGISMMPMLVTILVIIPLFTSGGYLLTSIGQEKGNRVMEILLVSLRPWQLLSGKLIGYGVLTLLQYVIWFGITGIALTISGQDVTEILGSIDLLPSEIIYIGLFSLGGYALYSAFMAGIGALAPNVEGGRSWVMLISLPMIIPIYVWTAIVTSPHSTVAVALSLIPFSAPVAMLMRMTSTTVPPVQIFLSLSLLLLATIEVIWLMARLFRVQSLLSGEAISLKRIWSVLSSQ